MTKYNKNSGLSKEEFELEKIVDKIKNTESTLECIGILRNELKNESDQLFERLFHHTDKPSKRWPQVTVGKRKNNETTWFTGGVDDEFRDLLVAIEKHLQTNEKKYG